MKRYRVSLVWQLYGHVEIEADSEDEAIDIALGPDTPLPDGVYLDDSCEVDNIQELEGAEQ